MASRKEDEKNERTIRSLLKLPANKRCINCNSLGPQYVCTNFWTFVCTTCSGIHREFTHRVKSVSMAKFTSQEVAALQSGGNERAKSIYFKDWDTQRHSFPDSSNIDRLRDFIRHVYVDRRFSGDKASEKPPRGEDSHENRKSDTSYGGSRSPPYEDGYERRRNDRPSPGGRSPPYEDNSERRRYDRPNPGGRSDDSYSKYDDRSPGHDRESRYSSDQGKSPNRPEIVNDWRREDRFGNARRPDDRRTSDVDSFSEGRSPDHQKDMAMSSPPVVRPVRDILGDNVIALKIDPPKPNNSQASDAPVHVVRTTSTSSHGSADGSQVENKRETLASLIDFGADPEPPVPAAPMPPIEPKNSVSATFQPTISASNDNWASFDFAAEAKVPQVQSTSNSILDSLLTLSASSTALVQSGQSQNLFASGGEATFFAGGGSNSDMPVGSLQMSPSNAGVSAGAPFNAVNGPTSAPVNGNINFNSMNLPGSWPGVQHQQQPYAFPHGTSPHLSFQRPSSFPAAQPPHPIPRNANEVANGFETQPPKAETKSSERSELPEDLFAATYHPSFMEQQGWHTGHQAGMGYAMQYNVAAPTHSYPQPSKSSNPFDFGNEPATAPGPLFPSMTTLHNALPTIQPPSAGLMHNSGAGAPSPVYMQHHVSSYQSTTPLQVPSYASGMPSGSYFTQQVPQNAQATRSQGVGGIGDNSFLGSANPNLLMAGGYATPTAPNPFPSAGGNPFG